MKTIKASLKLNKNGRLFCSVHNTYRVVKPPKSNCKICWVLYNNSSKQDIIDYLTEILDRNGTL